MIDLNKEFDERSNEIELIRNEISELKKSSKVKRYISLQKELRILIREEREIYRVIKTKEYDDCNHGILVYSGTCTDKRGRIQKTCGCVQCGLDESVLVKDKDKLTFEETVMREYFSKHTPYLLENGFSKECDLSLGKAIYNRIKEIYPDIDDEKAKKYFKYALNHIKYVSVNESRKKSRARRLSLNEDFDNWKSINDNWKNRKKQ